MKNKTYIFIPILILLSSFTHLWNPVGFPKIHWDEYTYLMRGLYFSEGFGPQSGGLYDHPYFGWIFLGSILKFFGYNSSINTSATDADELASLYLMPRVLMGILAIIDTLLLYKITEKRYNSAIAFIAALFFSVMPMTWLLRRFLLDIVLLPFALGSILVSQYIGEYRGKDKYLALFSGLLLGTAIFTKIPAFTFIPVGAYLILKKSRKNFRSLGLWFIPVLVIPALWPTFAMYLDEFDMFLDGVAWQSSRQKQDNHLFYIEKALKIFFSIDPLLITLGVVGSIFATLKRDFLFIIWILPFIIFVIVNGYASNFHFIIIFPPLCIAAAFLVYRTIHLIIKSLKIRTIVMIISVLSLGIAAMTSTTSAISSTAAFDYYEPMSYVARQIQNDTSGNITLRFDAIFSKPIYNETVNYIESTLALKEAYTLDNHAGIEWYDGNQMYYVFLREDKIGISSQQIDNEFMSSPIERQLGTWYTIKILYSDGMINIFLNGSLRMQVPNDSNPDISKVGIRTHSTVAEFTTTTVGHVNGIDDKIDKVAPKHKVLGHETLIGKNDTFSKPIYNKTVNYIESTLAVKEVLDTDNHAGIKWYDGNQEYYVFLRKNKISLWSQTDKEFMSSPIERQLGTWYSLKILYSDDMINIFLNGSLRMQVPNDSNPDISKVGIRSHNTVTEFQPLEVATAIPPRSNIWPIEYNILDFINSNLGDVP